MNCVLQCDSFYIYSRSVEPAPALTPQSPLIHYMPQLTSCVPLVLYVCSFHLFSNRETKLLEPPPAPGRKVLMQYVPPLTNCVPLVLSVYSTRHFSRTKRPNCSTRAAASATSRSLDTVHATAYELRASGTLRSILERRDQTARAAASATRQSLRPRAASRSAPRRGRRPWPALAARAAPPRWRGACPSRLGSERGAPRQSCHKKKSVV